MRGSGKCCPTLSPQSRITYDCRLLGTVSHLAFNICEKEGEGGALESDHTVYSNPNHYVILWETCYSVRPPSVVFVLFLRKPNLKFSCVDGVSCFLFVSVAFWLLTECYWEESDCIFFSLSHQYMFVRLPPECSSPGWTVPDLFDLSLYFWLLNPLTIFVALHSALFTISVIVKWKNPELVHSITAVMLPVIIW